jgi:hypothetical protein
MFTGISILGPPIDFEPHPSIILDIDPKRVCFVNHHQNPLPQRLITSSILELFCQ